MVNPVRAWQTVLPAMCMAAMFAFLAAPLSAQTKSWTVDEAVAAAVTNNLSLQRSAWDLEAKQRQSDKAWNVFLPSASVSGGLSRSNASTSSLTGATTDAFWSANGSLKFSLTLTGNVLVSLEAVALNYQSGLVSYELSKRALEKSVRLVFYSLLLEQENLKLTRDAIERSQKNFAKVQANYKAGLAPDFDVLSAQVAFESLKPQYQQLESSHLNNLGQLKVLLGIPLSDTFDLAGDLTSAFEKTVSVDTDFSRVSPDVQRAQLAVDTTELTKRAQDLNSWIPALSLSWTTAPANLDLFRDWYNGSTPTRPKAKNEWQDGGSLLLAASYSFDSLLPWSGAKENLLQAEDGIRKAQSQLQETKINSELTRQNLKRSIDQAVVSLSSLELNVQLAQKAYDLSQAAYNQGSKDLLAVQSAEGDLNSARYKVLAQRYTLLSNLLSLEYELNVPFGTLIKGVNP